MKFSRRLLDLTATAVLCPQPEPATVADDADQMPNFQSPTGRFDLYARHYDASRPVYSLSGSFQFANSKYEVDQLNSSTDGAVIDAAKCQASPTWYQDVDFNGRPTILTYEPSSSTISPEEAVLAAFISFSNAIELLRNHGALDIALSPPIHTEYGVQHYNDFLELGRMLVFDEASLLTSHPQPIPRPQGYVVDKSSLRASIVTSNTPADTIAKLLATQIASQ